MCPRIDGGGWSRESEAQETDLENCLVYTAGSHLRPIYRRAVAKCKLCSSGTRKPSLQAGNAGREAYPRSPIERNPRGAQRVWRLRAPAYGLGDDPAAFHKTLHAHLLAERDLRRVLLRPIVLRCGSPTGNLRAIRDLRCKLTINADAAGRELCPRRRFGKLEIEEAPFPRVGISLSQTEASSVTAAQKIITRSPRIAGRAPSATIRGGRGVSTGC